MCCFQLRLLDELLPRGSREDVLLRGGDEELLGRPGPAAGCRARPRPAPLPHSDLGLPRSFGPAPRERRDWQARFCKCGVARPSVFRRLLRPAAHSQTYPCLPLPRALRPGSAYSSGSRKSSAEREHPGTRRVRLRWALSPARPALEAHLRAQVFHQSPSRRSSSTGHSPCSALGNHRSAACAETAHQSTLLSPTRPRGVTWWPVPPSSASGRLQLLMHCSSTEPPCLAHKPHEGAPSSCPGPPRSLASPASRG